MPISEGLLEQGWIDADGLIPHRQPIDLREQLWLLLPDAPLPRSREARHLIRTLRQRVVKAGEALFIEHGKTVPDPQREQSRDPSKAGRKNNAENA